MPLFECAECHSVDNTALTNFWFSTQMENNPALCSACDPEIGEWHGKFPRITLDEYRILHPDAKPVEYPVSGAPEAQR